MPKSRICAKIQKVSDIAACFSEKVRKKMNKPKRTRQDERMNGEKHENHIYPTQIVSTKLEAYVP